MTDLNGQRILITRDSSQAGSLGEMLSRLGAEVFCVPTIDITDPPDWSPFDQAAEQLPDFDWLVFSSVNAVTRTSGRLAHLDMDLKFLSGVRIAAVGNQTARAAEDAGWKTDLVPDRFQAEDLVSSLIRTNIKENRIWIPRALEARPLLVEELRKAGAVVIETPVYRNRIPLENRDRLRKVLTGEHLDWITFTSSSTVVNFFRILGEIPPPEQLPRLASIGRITTRTIEEHGLVPAFTAKPQNLEGLCQGILNA